MPHNLDRYEVFLRDTKSDHRWSYFFYADDFAHAEEQVKPYVITDSEIICITKDYANAG